MTVLKEKIEDRMNKDFENLSALKMRREATEKMLNNLILIYQTKWLMLSLNYLKIRMKKKKMITDIKKVSK